MGPLLRPFTNCSPHTNTRREREREQRARERRASTCIVSSNKLHSRFLHALRRSQHLLRVIHCALSARSLSNVACERTRCRVQSNLYCSSSRGSAVCVDHILLLFCIFFIYYCFVVAVRARLLCSLFWVLSSVCLPLCRYHCCCHCLCLCLCLCQSVRLLLGVLNSAENVCGSVLCAVFCGVVYLNY